MMKWILGASLSLDFAAASEVIVFSALSKNGKQRLVQVLKVEKEEVTYIDITENLKIKKTSPFALFESKSFDEVAKELESLKDKTTTAKYLELFSPLEFKTQHLCAGLNYKDHVEESGQKEEMVLFPKYGKVVGHNSRVITSKETPLPELLDYEVELGVIFNKDIRSKADTDSALGAFMIANDFSDRAPQVYFYGAEGKPSSYSFTAAKSKENYTLVGPLVAIPKDWKSFSKNLDMELYVNGELKQKSSTALMSGGIEELIERALNYDSSLRWPLLSKDQKSLDEENTLQLLPSENSKAYIPAGMLFLTGTPGGTVFQKPTTFDLLGAALKAPFTKTTLEAKSFKDKIKIALIQAQAKSGRYLKAGDTVESKIDSLGYLNFTISEKF